MDLRKADLLKSNALDALYRGKKPEATRAYQELIEMYELYPFMLDARLALYFNTLLAYLDRHDSPQADQVPPRESAAASVQTQPTSYPYICAASEPVPPAEESI